MTDTKVAVATARGAALLAQIFEVILPHVMEADADRVAAIRAFYLKPQQDYSFSELAAFWRIDPEDVRDIYHDLLLRSTDEDEPRISWAAAAAATTAFNLLRPLDVERALGSDFERVRPAMWRTTPVLIHLPQFLAEAVNAGAALPDYLSLAARIETLMFEMFGEKQIRDADRVAQQ